MYVISRMPESNMCFGECLEDGFYVEGKTYFDVQEKLEKHEVEIDKNSEEQMSKYSKLNCPECGAPLEVYYDGPHCGHPEPWLIRHCEKCLCDWESEWHEDGSESELKRKFWG